MQLACTSRRGILTGQKKNCQRELIKNYLLYSFIIHCCNNNNHCYNFSFSDQLEKQLLIHVNLLGTNLNSPQKLHQPLVQVKNRIDEPMAKSTSPGVSDMIFFAHWMIRDKRCYSYCAREGRMALRFSKSHLLSMPWAVNIAYIKDIGQLSSDIYIKPYYSLNGGNTSEVQVVKNRFICLWSNFNVFKLLIPLSPKVLKVAYKEEDCCKASCSESLSQGTINFLWGRGVGGI